MRREGALKTAAKRLGLSLADYQAKLADGLKWCHQCKRWLAQTNFCTDNSRGDRLSARCRECRYRRTPPGPSLRERRDMRESGKAWCRRCAAWLPREQVYGGLCRPHINQGDRERYASDPKYRAERRQHAHARKRGIRPIPVEGQEILTEKFGGCCAYCSEVATTWDHLFAVVRGGETTPGNIVPSCVSCNSSKKDRDLDAWMKRKGFVPSDELAERLILAEAGLYG